MVKNIRENINHIYKIGEISEIFNISIQALRHYERNGILKPECIDETNNYRYYSTKQFERLNTIKYLRSLDVSIKNISDFLKEKDIDKILELLNQQHVDISQKIIELTVIQNNLKYRIDQIQSAISQNLNEVQIVSIKKRKILKIEKDFKLTDNIEYLLQNLSKKYSLGNSIFLGKIGISISKKNLINHKFSTYSSIFMILDEDDIPKYPESLASEGLFINIRFNGLHKNAENYYKQCIEFINTKGFEISGDALETTLIDGRLTADSKKFVTDIQIPIKTV